MNIGEIGFDGENFAVKYLKSKHYKIIERNYQTRQGEIDIICSDKAYIVFVEVKTRSANYMVSGIEAVNYAKQKRITNTALKYLQENMPDLQPRFDVIEIIVNGKERTVNHIENAFSVRNYHGFF